MSDLCTTRPVSWLKLEQYNLGELSEKESARIETHLGECPVCAQCMNSIREQTFSLPALPKAKPRGFGLRWAMAGVGLAAAAVLALVLATADWEKTAAIPSSRISFKGGDLSVSLVRERKGEILHAPETFAAGDRFKLLVTCPPGEEFPWVVVVFQDGQASFPYPPGTLLSCGNRVPLKGAFRLTGESRAVVCLAVGQAGRPSSIDELPADSVCVDLDPAAR